MRGKDDVPYTEVQRKTGSFVGTSGTAAFDAVTTAGSQVFLCLAGADAPGFVTPTGFALYHPNATGTVAIDAPIYSKAVSAGENTWSITMSAGTAKPVAWLLIEYAGLDATYPSAIQTLWDSATNTATTVSSLDIVSSYPATYDNLALAITAVYTTDGSTPTITANSNGFNQLDTVTATNGATLGVSMTVSVKSVTQTAVAEHCPATFSATVPMAGQGLSIWPCTGYRTALDLREFNGFEFGPAGGLTSGAAANVAIAPLRSTTGTFSVETAAKRSGAYGVRVFATSAISRVQPQRLDISADGAPTSGFNAFVVRFCLRFRSALPANDVQVFSLGSAQIWYRTASQKLAAVISGGTEQAGDAIVSAGHWIGIDLRYDTVTTAFTLDWSIDYNADPGDLTPSVPQTQVTFTAGAAVSTADPFLGWQASTTADVDYDDYAASYLTQNYPLGDIRVWPLTVDTAATSTASGTIGNFALVTANATGTTLSTGNIATAAANLTEVPVVVGASAAGVCQITTDASSYLEFPLTTRVAATNGETILQAKLYLCGWSAAAQTNTLWLAVNDPYYGQVLDLLTTATTPAFGTTTAVWVCGLVRTSIAQAWVQSRLDDLRVRMGKSTDAAPDVGLLAVLAEVAMQAASTARMHDVEGGTFTADVSYDPSSLTPFSYLVTTPADRGATFTYTLLGTPTSTYVAAGSAQSVVVSASAYTDVTDTSLLPDPVP